MTKKDILPNIVNYETAIHLCMQGYVWVCGCYLYQEAMVKGLARDNTLRVLARYVSAPTFTSIYYAPYTHIHMKYT